MTNSFPARQDERSLGPLGVRVRVGGSWFSGPTTRRDNPGTQRLLAAPGFLPAGARGAETPPRHPQRPELSLPAGASGVRRGSRAAIATVARAPPFPTRSCAGRVGLGVARKQEKGVCLRGLLASTLHLLQSAKEVGEGQKGGPEATWRPGVSVTFPSEVGPSWQDDVFFPWGLQVLCSAP